MKLKSTAVMTLGCMFIAFGTQLAAETWDCKIKQNNSTGFMPNTVIFETTQNSADVKVLDGITYSILGRAVRANVSRNDSKRIEMKWRSGKTADGGSNDVEVAYNATFLRKKKLLVLGANLVGWDNTRQSSRGKCQLSTATMKQVLNSLK